MDNITSIIAVNLQSLRKERQMTLQELSDLTGVSKSMLGEIERGTSSPTITVLWKISTGLKISISQLIHEPTPGSQMVREDQWRVLKAPPANISLIFECDHTRNFEVYHLEFQPGGSYLSNSHDKGVVEYMMVYEGQFKIKVNKQSFNLDQGDSLIFDAQTPHSYHNPGQAVAKAYSLINYSNV